MWFSRGFAELILRRIDDFERRVERIEQLEKRLANLEEQIQSQSKKAAESIMLEIAENLEKIIQNCHY